MVRFIRSAHRLTARERQLAGRALAWLAIADVALRVRGFPAVRRGLERVRRGTAERPATAAECVRAIERAARLYPWAKCLARAIAAAALLRREGAPSVLHIGVGFDEASQFRAHAWLESAGVVVTGAGVQDAAQPLLVDRLPPL